MSGENFQIRFRYPGQPRPIVYDDVPPAEVMRLERMLSLPRWMRGRMCWLVVHAGAGTSDLYEAHLITELRVQPQREAIP